MVTSSCLPYVSAEGMLQRRPHSGSRASPALELSNRKQHPDNPDQLTSSKRLSLNTKVDSDTVLLLSLLKHGNHDFRAVVDGEDNVLYACLNECLLFVRHL